MTAHEPPETTGGAGAAGAGSGPALEARCSARVRGAAGATRRPPTAAMSGARAARRRPTQCPTTCPASRGRPGRRKPPRARGSRRRAIGEACRAATEPRRGPRPATPIPRGGADPCLDARRGTLGARVPRMRKPLWSGTALRKSILIRSLRRLSPEPGGSRRAPGAAGTPPSAVATQAVYRRRRLVALLVGAVLRSPRWPCGARSLRRRTGPEAGPARAQSRRSAGDAGLVAKSLRVPLASARLRRDRRAGRRSTAGSRRSRRREPVRERGLQPRSADRSPAPAGTPRPARSTMRPAATLGGRVPVLGGGASPSTTAVQAISRRSNGADRRPPPGAALGPRGSHARRADLPDRRLRRSEPLRRGPSDERRPYASRRRRGCRCRFATRRSRPRGAHDLRHSGGRRPTVRPTDAIQAIDSTSGRASVVGHLPKSARPRLGDRARRTDLPPRRNGRGAGPAPRCSASTLGGRASAAGRLPTPVTNAAAATLGGAGYLVGGIGPGGSPLTLRDRDSGEAGPAPASTAAAAPPPQVRGSSPLPVRRPPADRRSRQQPPARRRRPQARPVALSGLAGQRRRAASTSRTTRSSSMAAGESSPTRRRTRRSSSSPTRRVGCSAHSGIPE